MTSEAYEKAYWYNKVCRERDELEAENKKLRVVAEAAEPFRTGEAGWLGEYSARLAAALDALDKEDK